jgi:hypothetical protein
MLIHIGVIMKRQTKKRVSKYSLLLRTQGVGLKPYLAMQGKGIKVLGLDATVNQIQALAEAKAEAKARKKEKIKAEEERKARELALFLKRQEEREQRKKQKARKEARRAEKRAERKAKKEKQEASVRKLSRKRLNSNRAFKRIKAQIKGADAGRKVFLPAAPTTEQRAAETAKFKAVQAERQKQKLQAKIAEISGDWRLACKLNMMLEGVA